jgi:threonine aldolase
VALETMTARLAEDHANARHLAQGLSDLPGIQLDPDSVQTNIVYINFSAAAPPAVEIADRLSHEGVRVLATGPHQIRAVTHFGISGDDIAQTIAKFRVVMKTSGL